MSQSPQEPYSKSFEDELDWTLLDQLHKVVLQIGTFCFRTKQICITVEIAIVGLLIKFTDNELDSSVFVAGGLIPLAFWFLDGVAYYYQVKLRAVMTGIQGRLQRRNVEAIVAPTFEPIIAETRIKARRFQILLSAFVNHSMWLYAILVGVDAGLWACYHLEWIGT